MKNEYFTKNKFSCSFCSHSFIHCSWANNRLSSNGGAIITLSQKLHKTLLFLFILRNVHLRIAMKQVVMVLEQFILRILALRLLRIHFSMIVDVQPIQSLQKAQEFL